MTSDGEALLRAVGENPWDDTPRLVYADWLEENNQADRAELIRLEIAIENLVQQRHTLLPGQSDRREELAPVRSKWLKELPKLSGIEWDTSFDRGFPDRVNASSATAFLKNAEAIYRIAPMSWVKIRGSSSSSLKALMQSPYLARLRGLDLRSSGCGDYGVRMLCASPHLSRLQVLNVSSIGMSDSGLRTLAKCRGLGGLWALWLNGNRITNAGAIALAGSPHFPKLESVFIHDTQITARGKDALERMARKNKNRSADAT